jgi:hypothetical protein
MRGVQAKAINDAGDIVGTANDEFTNVNVAFWPAASPGTVVVINPDPAQYYYAAPIDIDEQGRILLETEGGPASAIVRSADGTFSEIPPTAPSVGFWPEAFRNGCVAGTALNPTPPYLAPVELGIDGHVVSAQNPTTRAPPH